MAGDQAQFYQLLNSLLSADNDIRSQAEVSKFLFFSVTTILLKFMQINFSLLNKTSVAASCQNVVMETSY